MKKIICTVLVATTFLAATAQQTRAMADPLESFKQAKEYYQKEYYSLAYPIFKDLNLNLRETDRSNESLNFQEIKYYTIVCALKQNERSAVEQAREYIDLDDNVARVEMMSFHLGEYHFRQRDYYQAASYFEQTSVEHLSNREIADMKFHQAYAYFNLQRFELAKPLFDVIRQLPKDPNYIDANYYYGFIAFNERRYREALASFKVVENEKQYAPVVPFYVANIYYNTDQKEKALTYAEDKLKQGGQVYDLDLRQLVGHGYFEKQNYGKALPYLEDYVNRSKKVRREDLYEVSYAYYQTSNYAKAIDGFKQLGGKEDSLAQNSMYLLGDAYLKTNQKANARNAFLFTTSNNSNDYQREVASFNYAKLSYELGYQDVALTELQRFLAGYPGSTYNSEAKELLVAVLANTNNYKDALTLLASLQSPSENAKRQYAKILYGRATELVNDGLLVSANDLLNKALADPFNASVLPYINFWKGEISFRLSNTDDAIKYYFEYLKSPAVNGEINPVNAKYNLGYCFLKKENYKQALGFFEQIVKTPKVNSISLEQDAYIRSADCYYMSKDFKRALAMYDQVISFSWPSSDYATFQKALVAGVNSGSEKIRLLQSIPRIYPLSTLVPDANLEIANSYLSDEKYQESVSYLKNVVTAVSGEALKPRALLKMGIAYYNLNNNKEALNQLNLLLKQYPNSPEAEEGLENARTIYVEEGRTSEYVAFAKNLGKEITNTQEDSLTYAAAEVQFSNGSFDAALGRFENYLSKFPDGKYSLEANYYKSEIYYNKKDMVKATAGYEIVANRVPNKFGEKSLLRVARLNFFEIKNYEKAEQYFTKLKEFAGSQENKLEAMRGLLRSQFQLQKWTAGVDNAKDLLQQKGSSTDDKVLANFALAKAAETDNQCDAAIGYFKSVVSMNKASYGAESRYGIASCLLQQEKLKEAEKAAFEVINKAGSYGNWVTKAYILLGDIYFKQKDYFNAKATFQSVVQNAGIPELKTEAQQKLDKVIEAENKESKVGQ
ncbi:MAG: tetratricopeptide repeat protein [Chitinophagaceae bacterium]